MQWRNADLNQENSLFNKEMMEVVYLSLMKVKLAVKKYLKKEKNLLILKHMSQEKVSENLLYYIIVPELPPLKLPPIV